MSLPVVGITTYVEPAQWGHWHLDAALIPYMYVEAIARLEQSTVARQLLGDEVVDHYLHYARTEQELFDKTVTGYERERMFERG